MHIIIFTYLIIYINKNTYTPLAKKQYVHIIYIHIYIRVRVLMDLENNYS